MAEVQTTAITSGLTGVSNDTVFEQVATGIAPKIISVENRAVIEAFADILSELSPVSVNNMDIFYKGDPSGSSHPNHIKGIQDGFAEMFLENFWSAIENAKNDYKLRNRLQDILASFVDSEGNSLLTGDLEFFTNTDELYTMERFLAGKEFKLKKGTHAALEYAYKAIWQAEVEGPLRQDYSFNITADDCPSRFLEGFYINPIDDPIHPGVIIGTARISDYVSGATVCNPFKYSIEGSMLTEFFLAVVKPLAHPVGFNYDFIKSNAINFEDIYGSSIITRASSVRVYSLCPDGNCAEPSEIVYAARGNVVSVSNSELRNTETGKIYIGERAGQSFTKYIFENGGYLISYTITSDTGIDYEIEYYANNGDLIPTDVFETYTHSSVLVINPSVPRLEIETTDTFDLVFDNTTAPHEDALIELFDDTILPIVGLNMHIQSTTLAGSLPDEGGFIIGGVGVGYVFPGGDPTMAYVKEAIQFQLTPPAIERTSSFDPEGFVSGWTLSSDLTIVNGELIAVAGASTKTASRTLDVDVNEGAFIQVDLTPGTGIDAFDYVTITVNGQSADVYPLSGYRGLAVQVTGPVIGAPVSGIEVVLEMIDTFEGTINNIKVVNS